MLKNKDKFAFSVSYTTREPRFNEKHGREYFFVSKETFEKEIYNKKFLEYNTVYGNYYGTHRDTVEAIVKSGQICILDIDIQGFRDVVENGLKVYYSMFIMPPNIETLRKRLMERGTDKKEAIDKRVATAKLEIELALQSSIFHSIIINDNVDEFLLKSTKQIEQWYPILNK
jgi:guanylate kinase